MESSQPARHASRKPLLSTVGALSAFGAAVLFYRAVYRLFAWVFSLDLFGVTSWLANLAGCIVLVVIAVRVWSRWRLVAGSSLLFFASWTLLSFIPTVQKQGIYDDRWLFINTTASVCTIILLTTVAVVAIGRETLRAAVNFFRRRLGAGASPNPSSQPATPGHSPG